MRSTSQHLCGDLGKQQVGTGASRYLKRPQVLTWECAYKFYLHHRCQGNTGGGGWSWLSGKKSPPPLSTLISWQRVAFMTALLQLLLFLDKVAHFIQIPARCKYSEDTARLALSPEPLGDEPASRPGPQARAAASLCFHVSFISLLPHTGLTACPPICVAQQSGCEKQEASNPHHALKSRAAPVVRERASQLCFGARIPLPRGQGPWGEGGAKPHSGSRAAFLPQRVPRRVSGSPPPRAARRHLFVPNAAAVISDDSLAIWRHSLGSIKQQ